MYVCISKNSTHYVCICGEWLVIFVCLYYPLFTAYHSFNDSLNFWNDFKDLIRGLGTRETKTFPNKFNKIADYTMKVCAMDTIGLPQNRRFFKEGKY